MRQREGSWQNFFSSRWFLAGGTLVLVLLLVAFGRAYYKQYLVRQEINRLKSEVSRLQGKKLEVLDSLNYTESKAFVEEKARQELNLVKNGEKMVIINSKNGPIAGGQTGSEMIQLSNVSNLVKWWEYFFDN